MQCLKYLFVLFIVFSFNIESCIAAQQDFQWALIVGSSAIKNTENFAEPIIKGDYQIAQIRYSKCESESDSLDIAFDFAHEKNFGIEAKEVLMRASIIVIRRKRTLDYYMSAVEAHVNKQENLCEEYLKEMYDNWNEAVSARQEFQTMYGI